MINSLFFIYEEDAWSSCLRTQVQLVFELEHENISFYVLYLVSAFVFSVYNVILFFILFIT